jgi:hypothetical protein
MSARMKQFATVGVLAIAMASAPVSAFAQAKPDTTRRPAAATQAKVPAPQTKAPVTQTKAPVSTQSKTTPPATQNKAVTPPAPQQNKAANPPAPQQNKATTPPPGQTKATNPAPGQTKAVTPPAGQTRAAGTPAGGRGAAAPGAASTTGRDSSLLGPPVVLMREVYEYDRNGRRDPFISLLTTTDLRPTISDLKLLMTVVDEPGRSVALVSDAYDRKQPQKTLRVGTRVGRMRVASIRSDVVVFTIEEFGMNRRDSLLLAGRDTSKVR